MAKPSPAAVHTPRPASIRSTRASVGSSSTPRPPIPAAAANSKGVAKCLAFHDGDFTFPDDLAPLLDLPDPAEDSSTTTTAALISAAPDPDDAITASADSALTEVRPPRLRRWSMRRRRRRSPSRTRSASRSPSCAAAAASARFKLLVAALATVFAIDVALAVALVSRRGNDLYDVLPPT
uniref:Uncharacterized protein n=1 Tax=Oryza barthii TaxID=65489 RepID=A0A0D3FCA7_9ORYZ